MRSLVVVAGDEGVKARLLLEDIRRGGFGRLCLQRAMHALVSPVLLRMAGLNPFDLNAEAEPPHGELAEPV